MVSVVVPVFNEEQVVAGILEKIYNILKNSNTEFEIVVVNDGSTDKTPEILNKLNFIKIVSHPYNKGYGASLKTGIKNAKYNWIITHDADNQHRSEYILDLLKAKDDYDMVIGARQGYKGPFIRQPGKWVLIKIAEYLVGQKIQDLNSGLRIFKKDLAMKFFHLYPRSYSMSTNLTMAFLKEDFNVGYIPITINKRVGKSPVRPKDALKMLALIIRIIIIYSPIRIFFPISLFFILATTASIINDLMNSNFSDLTVLLFIASIMVSFFGLLTDQVAAIRREMKK